MEELGHILVMEEPGHTLMVHANLMTMATMLVKGRTIHAAILVDGGTGSHVGDSSCQSNDGYHVGEWSMPSTLLY